MEDYLHLLKFAYNYSYDASIKMAQFKGLYRRKCISLVYCDDIKERKLLKPEVIMQMVDKVDLL